MKRMARLKFRLGITPNAKWAQRFWDDLTPLKERIVNHRLFREADAGALSIESIRKALICFYPLIESFPKFMALNLAKTRPLLPGHAQARGWLIENIAVEESHADWWMNWAKACGCTQEELDEPKPNLYVDALNNYLWQVNLRASLVEGIAATNLAVEWPTGEWAKVVIGGVKGWTKYGISLDERALQWLQAHASYDDKHGDEAMELIKLCVTTVETQNEAFTAAKRSMEYYLLGLDHCLAD